MINFREIALAEYPPIDPPLPMGTPLDNLRQQSRTLQRKELSLNLSAPFARTPAQTPKMAQGDSNRFAVTAEPATCPVQPTTQLNRQRAASPR